MYSQNEAQAIVKKLYQTGWDFEEDTFYPVTDARRMGWWINKSHETKCRRTGDSKPFYYAAEVVFDNYTGLTVRGLEVKAAWLTPEMEAMIAKNKAAEAKRQRARR